MYNTHARIMFITMCSTHCICIPFGLVHVHNFSALIHNIKKEANLFGTDESVTRALSQELCQSGEDKINVIDETSLP